MKRYSQNIKRIICCLMTGVFFLMSYQANALECGVMQLQSNRSSGVSMEMNDCQDQPYVSIGTVFDLSPKGRLWLKSNTSKFKGSEFQMICQNRTMNSLRLEFSDMLLPWLSQSKLSNCTGWVDNKLSCDGINGEKGGVLCALSFIKSDKSTKTKQVERTTSVKMRDIKNLLKAKSVILDKQQILEAIKPELKLCKKINDTKETMTVNWVVQEAVVSDIELTTSNKLDKQVLFDCLEAVIRSAMYPKSTKEVLFKADL